MKISYVPTVARSFPQKVDTSSMWGGRTVMNKEMGKNPLGPDYGMFNFVNLFSEALLNKPRKDLTKAQAKKLFSKFEHKVSDHLPLWLRLPLPKD